MIIGSKIYQNSLKNFQIMMLLMGSDQRKGIFFNDYFFGGGVFKIYCEGSWQLGGLALRIVSYVSDPVHEPHLILL